MVSYANASQKKAPKQTNKWKEQGINEGSQNKDMGELLGPLLPRKRFSSRHHMILRIAVNVAVLDTPPYIDQEDLDLGFRPTQGHERFVRPTRQRLKPVGLAPRTDSLHVRIGRPCIGGDLGNAGLNVNKPQLVHPPRHPVCDPELPGRVRHLARSDAEIEPVMESELAVAVWVFWWHSTVVALGFRV